MRIAQARACAAAIAAQSSCTSVRQRRTTHPESLQTLATAYRDGELGLPRDPKRAEAMMAELADALRRAPPLP
jgi:hypothetical protein